jgi:mycothiol maleylpyruvate isomerase-like protein
MAEIMLDDWQMVDLERCGVEDALAAGWEKVTSVTAGLGDAEMMLPSRCAGWVVADVLYHLLLDAQMALVTFASPGAAPPDADDISYWRPWSPRSGEPQALGSPGAARHAMHVRVAASAYTARHLTSEWQLTSMAALRAARACPYPLLAAGNAVLTTTDFIATLVVETAVHYLDLTVGIASAPAADPASLVLVRRVLDGLLGTELSGLWDDSTYALKGTGRLPVTAPERAMLGAEADKFPLFG